MRKTSIVLVAIAAAIVTSATPAAAGATRVSGDQIPVAPGDPCIAGDPSSLGTYRMDGSLVGCWYTDELTVREHPSGTVQSTGREHFVGCLDRAEDGTCTGDPSGTLYFEFQFSGKYDLVTFAEIRGRCQHPIVSGTGGFAGASGVLTFKDDVSTGIAPYSGTVMLEA